MKIDKAYVISLSERAHRWSQFVALGDDRIERFLAIDTRTNPIEAAKKYGFSINPVEGCYADYFSESKGGIGCYLSHYLIWKDIVKKELKCTLVVEDDAEAADIKKVLSVDNYKYKSFLGILTSYPFHVIQLNKRTVLSKKAPTWRQDDMKRVKDTIDMAFAGTESYLVSLEGAKRLIWLAENSEVFDNKLMYMVSKNAYACDNSKYIPFKNKREGKCIWAPVDKFMGRCNEPDLEDLRVNITVKPRVSLHATLNKSDITITEGKPHWKLARTEMLYNRTQPYYGWWGRGADIIPKEKIIEIGVKKTGTSSLGCAYRILGKVHEKFNPVVYDKWIASGEKDYDSLFEHMDKFEAFEDGPWHDCDYKVLDIKYPGSKFIILERDDKGWIDSLESHESPAINANNIPKRYLDDRWVNDRESMIAEKLKWKHEKYNEIKQYFVDRPGDLLVMNICEGDGFEVLCPFLNMDLPRNHDGTVVEFPHSNRSK